ncbi:MAG TPA: 16S rRNA (cytidine(1402)-2'-O)-methyltransferase [Solirubrobacteraceae bacterium]|nr:16S rRNA (cytidine(1402)-2'-O)-methyltransferase [Solirubrobacteraceae bacterium]
MSAQNPPIPGRLLVCPTPIGNLEDITLRVLRALAEADVLACEDTRRTGALLARHGISAARLLSYHERNEAPRARELVARMLAGHTVALVSDAGMPVLSDPGFQLVRACLVAEIPVEVLPGPSAVPVALVASGLPVARWCFVGFLPRKRGQRERMLRDAPDTLIAFESPKRLPATLALLAEIDPQRPVAVCRELTKLHEEVLRAGAAELAERYAAHPPKGEIVLVIAPAESPRAAPAISCGSEPSPRGPERAPRASRADRG